MFCFTTLVVITRYPVEHLGDWFLVQVYIASCFLRRRLPSLESDRARFLQHFIMIHWSSISYFILDLCDFAPLSSAHARARLRLLSQRRAHATVSGRIRLDELVVKNRSSFAGILPTICVTVVRVNIAMSSDYDRKNRSNQMMYKSGESIRELLTQGSTSVNYCCIYHCSRFGVRKSGREIFP